VTCTEITTNTLKSYCVQSTVGIYDIMEMYIIIDAIGEYHTNRSVKTVWDIDVNSRNQNNNWSLRELLVYKNENEMDSFFGEIWSGVHLIRIGFSSLVI
jgi:hypothetical protein